MLLTTTPPRFTTPPPALSPPLRRRLPLSATRINLSSTQAVEHIVLFNVKPNTTTTQLTSMLTGLNSLKSLPMVLHLTVAPLHKTLSTATPPLTFTHLLHSRYRSKPDLAEYSAHPNHLSVVRSSVLPICDDLMAVDWVARSLSGPVGLTPGSALRVQFLKLKEGAGEKGKDEVIEVVGGLKDKVGGIDQISVGENFSPERAKGFSVGSIRVFKGIRELEDHVGNVEAISKESGKIREYVDSLLALDYVVPSE